MTVRLIIARHGNTFEPNDPPRRIGALTDLPLTAGGHEQGRKLGTWLKANAMLPDVVYTSRLKRTVETAADALAEAGLRRALHQSDMFNEIDHGPDENKTDPEIAARIGERALRLWDRENAMPREWQPQPDIIRRRWFEFAAHCEKAHDNQTVMVVTSNGIARFAPLLANNAADMITDQNRKLPTGCLSVLEGAGGLWMISHWNIRP